VLAANLDRFPRQPYMAVITLHSKCAIVSVILFVTADATGRLGQFGTYRISVAINALEILVFSVQLEFGLVVIKIPILPVTGVVTGFTAFPESALMHILLFVARPAIRLGLFEHHGYMAFLALNQNMFSGELKLRHPVVKFNFSP
jgi:hypothetical protein